MKLPEGVALTWLGHGTVLLESPSGKRILIDPWVQNNPACPAELKSLGRLDLILVTHAHNDHIGDVIPLARSSGATTVAIFETAHWLQSKGVQRVVDMNKGGTATVEGIKVTMVHAEHSCGILDGGQILYGGEAVGYVVELENGFRLYHAGDTAVFSDMRLIGELYRPEVACLPIGDHYTMGPREAAYAIRLLGVRKVVPLHWGTFPVLTGTPQALREAAQDVEGLEVAELRPGDRIAG
ncbi:MAG TPA: metal-dependent hydrolase [Limnochorda sp.]